MNLEQELAQWRDDWRASTPKEEDQERWRALEKKVKSQSIRMRLYLALELLVSVSFLLISLYVSWRNPTPQNIVWAVAVWVFTFLVQGFSIWNQRGIWGPVSQDTRAFLSLSLQRCQAVLRAIKFCVYIIGAELVFLIVWLSWNLLSHPKTYAENLEIHFRVFLLGVFLSVGFLLFFIWRQKKQQREIASLKELQRTLNS
jgi:hypothetical protein